MKCVKLDNKTEIKSMCEKIRDWTRYFSRKKVEIQGVFSMCIRFQSLEGLNWPDQFQRELFNSVNTEALPYLEQNVKMSSRSLPDNSKDKYIK